MKRFHNLVLAVLVVLSLTLSAGQGSRVRHLRQSDTFYRWILAQATRERMFTDQAGVKFIDPEDLKMKDRELFAQVVDATENLLPGTDSTDDKGRTVKKLIAVTSDESQDWQVWDLARGPELASLRQDFLKYLRNRQILSVGSEFNPNQVYSGEGGDVALSNIFFGFRKVAANLVWLQVDRYWHQGYMHRMIPLMHTCVMLDPNFIEAYLLGAWHLAYNATAKLPDTPEPLKKYYPKYEARLGEKELYYHLAIDFLKDGILKNPRDYRLYFDLGFAIYDLKLKDYKNAVLYLSEAIRHRHDRWVPRQLYICLELNKQYQEALDGWKDYLEKNRDRPTEVEKAQRFIARNQGLIDEREAERLDDLARNTTDAAQAEKLRAQAEQARQKALKTWEDTGGPGGELDEFALGRIMRMKAVKLIGEGRYLEAIAVLQNAWSKSSTFAQEALDMIIDTKLKANIPLSVSEKKAVMRREEAEKYKQAPPPQS